MSPLSRKPLLAVALTQVCFQPLAELNTILLQLAQYAVLGFLGQLGAYMWFFDYTTWTFSPAQNSIVPCFIQPQHFQNLQSYCLLTPLMSPRDTTCELIDWLIERT